MREPTPPIIIIGGARSGTSMLCRLLSSAPGHCLWYEPNVVWRIGSAYRPDDTVPPEYAKGRVRRRIRRLFRRYQDHHSGARVVEKTPQNVLRVPFINRIFPEARFVHIYRDGRANLRSQVEKQETFSAYSFNRLSTIRTAGSRLAVTPWWEWPAYAPRAARGILRHATGRKVHWWGLRYPGWQRDLHMLTGAQISAKQWKVSIEQAFEDLDCLPAARRMHVRYEDLVRDPVSGFERICEFCDIEADEAFYERVCERVHPDSIERWRDELNPRHLEEAMPIFGELLEKLGYTDRLTADGQSATETTS